MESLRGHLLVASPRLPDTNFYRTVVLIIHHDEQGAFGVVLNRPTENSISDIWEAISDESCESSQRINVGGPVTGPLLALHTNDEYSENEIIPGVHFSAHKDYLNHIVNKSDHPFRIYSGYSGWAPGQLEGELEQGGWMVLPASYDYVFGDPNTMWRRASQEIGERITKPLVKTRCVPTDPGRN
jgi:putative transcriptional regulator